MLPVLPIKACGTFLSSFVFVFLFNLYFHLTHALLCFHELLLILFRKSYFLKLGVLVSCITKYLAKEPFLSFDKESLIDPLYLNTSYYVFLNNGQFLWECKFWNILSLVH